MTTDKLTEEQRILVDNNVRLVHHIVKKFSDHRIRKSEFVSAGYFGLVKAARSFDTSKGTKFTTFAGTCITNSILDLLAYVGKNHGRYASLDEMRGSYGSSNRSLKSSADTTRADTYDDGMRIEDGILQKSEIDERRLIVGLYLLNKSPRFAQIIKLRLQEGMTHEMIAQEIGISKSYISRILTRIEKELTAFKRKIDATDGQYYRRYTASDLEKARRVLDDPPEWSIHIERDETRKQDALSVNFQQKGIYFCSDIDDIIEDSDSNRVEIALTRNSASEGVVVFRFLQKAPYVIRDAKIENEKLIYWLSLQGLVPKRYTTCFYDDAELTLYVKVECAG